MKKSWIKIMALSLVTVLVATGCSTAKVEKDSMKATSTEVAKESMATEKVDDTKTDDMNKDDMKTDETQKEEMQKEDMAKETVVADDQVEMMTNKGDLAPAFEFVDFEGNVVNNDTLKGQKVYIKYWASWCSICLAGLSEVDELFVQDKDFTVYTVVTPNANGEKSQEEFKTWFDGLEQKNIKVLFDMKGQAAKEFGVRAFPTSVYIGSDGVLIQAKPGHMSNEDITNTVEAFY